MISMGNQGTGGGGSSRSLPENQSLSARFDQNGPIEAQGEISTVVAPSLPPSLQRLNDCFRDGIAARQAGSSWSPYPVATPEHESWVEGWWHADDEAGAPARRERMMAEPVPLVSDVEVAAAKDYLDKASDLAGRKQPVPDTIIRGMLEEAAMVRVGMLKWPREPR